MNYRQEIRAMLRVAVPLALAELGWMGMSVVDTVMVGRLPDSAVAIGGASLGSALFYCFAIFGIGLMAGMDTLVSHSLGAGDREQTRRWLTSGLAVAGCLSPILVACVFAVTPLLAIIGVTAPVLHQAKSFIHTLVWSLPPLLLYSTFRRYLQGLHLVRPITFALITANLVNVFGNWLLIYGNWGAPSMGIAGSALSTVIARCYMAAVLFLAIRLHDAPALRFALPRWTDTQRLIRLGLPAAITIGLEVGVFNTATALVGTLDPVSLAAHSIALNAASVTYMVPLGVASAAAVSVGRRLGLGDRKAAVRSGWTAIGIGSAFEVVSALGFLLFPRQIAALYTNDRQIIDFAVILLAVAAVFQLFDGLQTIATGALRGMGNTRTALIYNLAGYWILGLPLGAWLCFGLRWGAVGIWIGLCLALIIIGLGLLRVWWIAGKAE